MILGKYWDNQCTKNLIGIFSDYGSKRFWDWAFREEISFFLEYIIGKEKSKLLIDELKKFFQLNYLNPLDISIFFKDFYREILLQLGLFQGYWGDKSIHGRIKKCSVCGNEFNPYYIEWYLTKKPSKFISICGSCYKEADILTKKWENKTDEEMLTDLRNLVDVLGFIPNQNLGKIRDIIDNIPEGKEIEAIAIMRDMCGFHQYRNRFGSYFKALVTAGILDERARLGKRGTRCIAEDGHECRSLAEQYIDNWLYKNNIPHSREPYYPKKYLKADWKVGKYFIEYWGLKGQEDYDEKMEIKKKLARENNIPLIEISFSDLQNISSKLKRLKDEYGNSELATYEIALPYNGKKDKLMKELDGRSIDLMKIRGMGYTRIKKLNEAGIYSLEDVKNCSFSKLLSIEGLGDKLIKELLTLVGREEECYLLELKKTPMVWNETLIKLDKAGIKSMKQLSECDGEVLVRTTGIQIYIANSIKKYVDSLSEKKK